MQFIQAQRDTWHLVGGEDGPVTHPPVRAHSLLTLAQWHAVREEWPARGTPVGVVLPNDSPVEALAADLPRLDLVVLEFPKWVDGRAYSQARLLRNRYRYTGQIRATGDVVVDMMPLLARTGFDAVTLRRDQVQDSAERALEFFPGHYQGDVTQPRPAFARDVAQDLAADAQRRRARAEQSSGEGI